MTTRRQKSLVRQPAVNVAKLSYQSLVDAIAQVHETAQRQAVQAVSEFLGLKREELYTETQLERALLDHLQEFLLELGQGFCFVARQRRVTFDNEHYYVDLLLYNRRLRCLCAIDLILGHFRHEYAGR
jgi:predicted nuclease of restriction endonuclease-like (RecB) superfamily